MVGLGNPGPEYAVTRHNAGFLLADALAEQWKLGPFRRGRLARIAEGTVDGHQVLVVKPQTYMNRSGGALAPLLATPDFTPSRDLLVLVDDAALPLGTFRLRSRGSPGGHNGLKSIEAALGSQAYARLRIGTGPIPEHADLADFDLARFPREELTVLADLMPTLVEAVTCWVADGIETAMNRFNRRPKRQA